MSHIQTLGWSAATSQINYTKYFSKIRYYLVISLSCIQRNTD